MNLDWNWLKQECTSWLKSKDNDVLASEKNKALRAEAINKGFTHEQVSKAIHRCVELINESKHKSPRIDSKPAEASAEAPKEKMQAMRPMQQQKLSERARESPRAIEGLNPSGGKLRKSKISILDMADKRV